MRRFRGEGDAGMVPVLDPITIVNFGVWIGGGEFFFSFFLKEVVVC